MVAVLGAVAVTTVSLLRARAALTQQRINPEADVEELTTLLEGRGWQVSVEQAMGRDQGKRPRWSGQATLAAPPGSPVFRYVKHVRIQGADTREVLIRILAKVLEKEQAPRA